MRQGPLRSLGLIIIRLCILCIVVVHANLQGQSTPGHPLPLNPNPEEPVFDFPPFPVVGTRLKDSQLRETLPLLKLDRDYLDSTGFSTYDQAIQNLPLMAGYMNDGINEAVGESLGVVGITSVSMRGFYGANLVLIDGLRMPLNAANGNYVNPYNLSSVPSVAVEQVNVLTDGASAIYGADAVTGVVNIRTIKEYDGMRLKLGLGLAEGTDSGEFNFSVLHGGKIAGSTNFVVGFEYYERNNLRYSEYDFLDLNHLDRGGDNNASFFSYPALIRDPHFDFSSGNPPQFLSFRNPVESPSLETIEIIDWPIYLNEGGFNTNLYMDYLGDRERTGAYLNFTHTFSRNLRAWIQFIYQENQTRLSLAPTPAVYPYETIPVENPFNPYGLARLDGSDPVPISIYGFRLAQDGPRIYEKTSKIPRLGAGLQGKFGEDWNWNLSGVASEDRDAKEGRNFHVRELYQAVLNGIDFNNDGILSNDEYLNPFGPSHSQVYDHMRTKTLSKGSYSLLMLDAHVDGTLFRLEKFDLQAAAGMEYREEKLDFVGDENITGGRILGGSGYNSEIVADREVGALYTELAVNWYNLATLQVAGRYEEFSDFGDTLNPKVDLSFKIIPEVILRASYGEGFVAPPLPYLHKERLTGGSWGGWNIWDPKRDEPVNYGYLAVTGGNPHLEPETSVNKSFGIRLHPFARFLKHSRNFHWLKHLSLGADYIEIDYENLIDFPSLAFLLDVEDDLAEMFPGQDVRIIRGEPEPGQAFGKITEVYQVFINQSYFEYKGVDVFVDAAFDLDALGQVSLRWDGTYIDTHYYSEWGEQTDSEIIADYRWVAMLRWEKDNWGTNWYFQSVDGVDPRASKPDYPVAGVSFRINAQVDYSGIPGMRITLGARNLLDEDPPFHSLEWYGFFRGHPTEKRFWYLRIEKEF